MSTEVTGSTYIDAVVKAAVPADDVWKEMLASIETLSKENAIVEGPRLTALGHMLGVLTKALEAVANAGGNARETAATMK